MHSRGIYFNATTSHSQNTSHTTCPKAGSWLYVLMFGKKIIIHIMSFQMKYLNISLDTNIDVPMLCPRHTCPPTVYPKKYAHGFCFAVLCCGYTLTDFPISIRLTSLALWQSNDCPSASKATLMNRDKYFMWTHYERLHNHNKAKHNNTVCIFLGIYCITNNRGAIC